MNHMFNVYVAENHGVPEAILLSNLFFWVEKNKANNKHYHDGRYWTYNSQEAFTLLFPYWSRSQIKRIVASLVKQGLILKANYNAVKYDRTTWYTLSEKGMDYYKKSVGRNRTIEKKESPDETGEVDQPIPDVKPDVKPDKKHISTDSTYSNVKQLHTNNKRTAHSSDTYTDEFEQFWRYYPRKMSKKTAFKKWKATVNKGYTPQHMITAAVNYSKDCELKGKDAEYIKLPATFIGPDEHFLDWVNRKPERANKQNYTGPSNYYKPLGGDEYV